MEMGEHWAVMEAEEDWEFITKPRNARFTRNEFEILWIHK